MNLPVLENQVKTHQGNLLDLSTIGLIFSLRKSIEIKNGNDRPKSAKARKSNLNPTTVINDQQYSKPDIIVNQKIRRKQITTPIVDTHPPPIDTNNNRVDDQSSLTPNRGHSQSTYSPSRRTHEYSRIFKRGRHRSKFKPKGRERHNLVTDNASFATTRCNQL
jgi:hypothetical protein